MVRNGQKWFAHKLACSDGAGYCGGHFGPGYLVRSANIAWSTKIAWPGHLKRLDYIVWWPLHGLAIRTKCFRKRKMFEMEK